MGATNKTPNIELPQFVGTDKPSWLGDFNGAMNAIDTFAGKTTGDIGTVTGTANAAKSAAEAASASVTALETTVNQHTSEISDTMADVSSLEADVQQLQTTVTGLNNINIGSYQILGILGSGYGANADLSVQIRINNTTALTAIPSIHYRYSFPGGGPFDAIFTVRVGGNIFGLTGQSFTTGAVNMNIYEICSNGFRQDASNNNIFNDKIYAAYNATNNFTYLSFSNTPSTAISMNFYTMPFIVSRTTFSSIAGKVYVPAL